MNESTGSLRTKLDSTEPNGDQAGRPIRLGLIGGGPWGRNYIHTIGQVEGAVLVAFASQQEENTELAPPGCRFTTDWRQVIDDGGLDGLIVATPPPLHYEMTAAALEAGMAAMVEKPLTLKVEHAEALVRLAEARRLPVLVDHTLLFHPGFQKLQSLLDRLGTIRRVRCVGGGTGPFRPDTRPFEDYSPHSLALCLCLLPGRPTAIRAKYQQVADLPQGRGEVVRVEMDFVNGATAEIVTGNLLQTKQRQLEVVGDKGRAVFSDLAEDPLVIDQGDGPRAFAVPAEAPLTRAVATLVAGLRGEPSPLLGFELGAEIVRLMVECRAQLDAA